MDDPRTKTARRGFRPLPRYRDQMKRIVLDKAKIKRLYMAQPYYRFVDFFKHNGWEPKRHLIQEMGFRTWQKEWVESRVEEQDDETIARAVTLRQSVSQKRLDFIEYWTERYDPMSIMLKNTMTMYQNAMAAAANEANAKGKPHEALKILKKDHKHWAQEMEALMAAAHKLQKVQMTGLMLNEKDVEKIATRIQPRSPEERNLDVEGDEIQAMPMGIMDQTGGLVPMDQAQNLITKWYDQLNVAVDQKQAEAPVNETQQDEVFGDSDEDWEDG